MIRIGTTLATLAALVAAALAAPSCSGTPTHSEAAEALSRLPAALEAARDALEAARPILADAGESEAERLAVSQALDAMEGVLELGRALSRDVNRATARGGWAWAEAALRGVCDLARWLKTLGVPIPDALIAATEAATLLVPAIAGATGGGGS